MFLSRLIFLLALLPLALNHYYYDGPPHTPFWPINPSQSFHESNRPRIWPEPFNYPQMNYAPMPLRNNIPAICRLLPVDPTSSQEDCDLVNDLVLVEPDVDSDVPPWTPYVQKQIYQDISRYGLRFVCSVLRERNCKKPSIERPISINIDLSINTKRPTEATDHNYVTESVHTTVDRGVETTTQDEEYCEVLMNPDNETDYEYQNATKYDYDGSQYNTSSIEETKDYFAKNATKYDYDGSQYNTSSIEETEDYFAQNMTLIEETYRTEETTQAQETTECNGYYCSSHN